MSSDTLLDVIVYRRLMSNMFIVVAAHPILYQGAACVSRQKMFLHRTYAVVVYTYRPRG